MNIEQRLRATADRIAGLRAELEDECLTRDRQVLEAIDAGVPRSQVARWAQLSLTRVTQVVVEQASVG
ncbi:MAG: hypothetical protein ABSF84_02830 [Acidimicrobiales bacterium]|jgi:hypothetical protein